MKRTPGSGSVTPTPAGTWRVRVRDGAGRRRCVGTYASEVEARAVLAAALDKLAEADLPAVGVVTLRAWGLAWLEAREARGRDKEKSVWSRHVLPHLGHYALHEITRPVLAAWIDKLRVTPATGSRAGAGRGARLLLQRNLSPLTVRHALRLVRSALRAAVDAGRLGTNPAKEVAGPRPRPHAEEPWTFLTAAEVEAVVECMAIPDPERAVYTVAIYSGLRLGELWGLRWEDVTLEGDRPELVVRRSHGGPTKSGKVRRVPLLPGAAVALGRLPGRRTGWVFAGAAGKRRRKDDDARWSPDWRLVKRTDGTSYRAQINGYRERAGVLRRVRFHDLRHTCASHLLMGTWGVRLPLEEVAAWLGHGSTKMTERYAHLAPDHLSARVAAALAPPPPAPRSPTEGPSGGTDATGSMAQNTLRQKGRAMQESNLRPSASETEARRAQTPAAEGWHAKSVPAQSHEDPAVAVLLGAARGEALTADLLTALARAAIVAGVRGDLALALLDGSEHAARVAVDLAAALLAATKSARGAGEGNGR